MRLPTVPKQIYVNGRFLTQTTTGVQRYARETLDAMDVLLDGEAKTKWTVLTPKGIAFQRKWKNIEMRTVGRLSGHAWEQLELPRYASDGWLLTLCGAPSFLHSSHLFAIHDTAIYDMPMGYSFLYRAYYRILYRLCVNRAKVIFTVSEFSRSRLAALFPNAAGEIVITYGGADHLGNATEVRPTDAVVTSTRPYPYILAVSSLAPNKNFPLIFELAELLEGADVRILVVGAMNSSVFAKTDVSSSNISWLGYVSDDELERLYRHAACFVFPSLYEGFGLPPIEAMSLGCPVIASNAASIPEVCGNAALYFNPSSALELKSQFLRLLHESDLAEELRRRGDQQAKKFTWIQVALIINNVIAHLS